MYNSEKFLLTVLKAANEAGDAVLDIYNSCDDFQVEKKKDNSPLTIADKKSHEIISKSLVKNADENVNIQFMSEEGKHTPYDTRVKWDLFWLVDPIDGTKEFINRNGEFTINIALINNQRPVLGVVYVPVQDVFYYSSESLGAYKIVKDDEFSEYLLANSLDKIINKSMKLPIIDKDKEYTVVASRSHMNSETEDFINKLKTKHDKIEILSAGSSLKLCLVAEGRADVYPRLGPTMEWDTAAAHAIVNGAGKKVKVFQSDEELLYNKQDLLNPWFVVE